MMTHKPKIQYCTCKPDDETCCEWCDYEAYMDQEYDRRRDDRMLEKSPLDLWNEKMELWS